MSLAFSYIDVHGILHAVASFVAYVVCFPVPLSPSNVPKDPSVYNIFRHGSVVCWCQVSYITILRIPGCLYVFQMLYPFKYQGWRLPTQTAIADTPNCLTEYASILNVLHWTVLRPPLHPFLQKQEPSLQRSS